MRTRQRRFLQMISIVLVLCQFGIWMTAPAEAGVAEAIQRGINQIGQFGRAVVNALNNTLNGGRQIVINSAATLVGIVFGLGGAVVGGLAAGPLGFIGGAIGGYYLGKLMTKLFFMTPLPTAMGGIIGALLCASMGLPGIVLGALAGAAIGHLLSHGTIGNQPVFSLAAQDAKASAFISHLQAQQATERPTVTVRSAPVPLPPSGQLAPNQGLHERYRQAYRKYAEALEKGDQAEARHWLAIYQETAKALRQQAK
ncbi:MAG: hypothetical protein OZSIB_2323 [Candidatus Ozemobacter sibiricus]|uniref:Uncharacterized protein n=1 Tax=Candidatus Ozemobacter sibiricus TaxID=2268124 RepID=A0A367ZSD7_9BACT|nr:MAG: hypothetical protein OZSIB_2323 [Candidatus Ozemobacter sibiricus]